MLPLIEIRNLKVYFFTEYGIVKAVDGINYKIFPKEAVGIVGESGSGKSVSALSILGLVPPPGKVVDGEIIFEGKNLLNLREKQLQKIRGRDISIIFQDPFTSLNPTLTVGEQIIEGIILHQKLSKKEAYKKAIEILKLVGISSPEKRIYQYPHQLSGGQRQRVMIGIALSSSPSLLIADEPTTALDVTIQAQIIQLLKELKEKKNLSIILITHNLGIVADLCKRIIVMYAGKIVEEGNVEEIYNNPVHPYTQGLLKCVPRFDRESKRLPQIEGEIPEIFDIPSGCAFHPRCEFVKQLCREKEPLFFDVSETQKVKCWKLNNYEDSSG